MGLATVRRGPKPDRERPGFCAYSLSFLLHLARRGKASPTQVGDSFSHRWSQASAYWSMKSFTLP